MFGYKVNGIEKIKIGDVIEFGSYGYYENGKKLPIKWIVLDVVDGDVLLISEKCLDWQPYNQLSSVTWKDSYVRDWLSSFACEAFTDREREMIFNVPADEENESVFESSDKLFLLSVSEAEKYFQNDQSRICSATPYAVKRGAYIIPETGGCCWWLKDRGYSPSYAADVLPNGEICPEGDEVDEAGGIRPALWMISL